VDPGGTLKVDLPCRIFRNHRGIQFFGVVHEHPETALNEGPGFVNILSDVKIAHPSYLTDEIRSSASGATGR